MTIYCHGKPAQTVPRHQSSYRLLSLGRGGNHPPDLPVPGLTSLVPSYVRLSWGKTPMILPGSPPSGFRMPSWGSSPGEEGSYEDPSKASLGDLLLGGLKNKNASGVCGLGSHEHHLGSILGFIHFTKSRISTDRQCLIEQRVRKRRTKQSSYWTLVLASDLHSTSTSGELTVHKARQTAHLLVMTGGQGTGVPAQCYANSTRLASMPSRTGFKFGDTSVRRANRKLWKIFRTSS